MTLSIYFREDIAHVLRGLYLAHLPIYDERFVDALIAVGASFGVEDGEVIGKDSLTIVVAGDTMDTENNLIRIGDRNDESCSKSPPQP